MSERAKTVLKAGALAGLLFAALGLVVTRIRSLSATGEEGLQTWFYDESEQELYAVPLGTTAPHRGIGGTREDGVRAVVVARHGACGEPKERRIAYFEKYAPAHKELIEGVAAARRAGKPYDKPIPDMESGFYEKNTLVRLPDDAGWYELSSARGKQIVARWRQEHGPDGRNLDACAP